MADTEKGSGVQPEPQLATTSSAEAPSLPAVSLASIPSSARQEPNARRQSANYPAAAQIPSTSVSAPSNYGESQSVIRNDGLAPLRADGLLTKGNLFYGFLATR